MLVRCGGTETSEHGPKPRYQDTPVHPAQTTRTGDPSTRIGEFAPRRSDRPAQTPRWRPSTGVKIMEASSCTSVEVSVVLGVGSALEGLSWGELRF